MIIFVFGYWATCVVLCNIFFIFTLAKKIFNMKKYLLTAWVWMAMASCTPHLVNVLETQSVHIKSDGENFVFENDTLRIVYDFYAEKGSMSFDVFNKLNKPIYIDWRNSAFIVNGERLNYWNDATETEVVSTYSSVYYSGVLDLPVLLQEGTESSTSRTTRAERLSFIPPQSHLSKSQFFLFPRDCYDFADSIKKEKVLSKNDASKWIKMKQEIFTSENTPLHFRNYLAITMSENPTALSYVDNDFYVSKIMEMKYNDFRGKKKGTDIDGNVLYEKSYYEKRSYFYIHVHPKAME